MNHPTPYRRPTHFETAPAAVHTPGPLATGHAAPLVPVQPGTDPAVTTILLPDGRVITGYAIEPAKPEPAVHKPQVSRAAVNVALGGIGFLAVCGGLLMLTTFIAALTALVTQLVILAAVLVGGFVAVQLFTGRDTGRGTTVNIRKAVIKRNKFYG
ncbi:hypothetical protein ACFZAM_04040 [Streptomyces sp. NPDC008079]|uniref:hypothetical protein n=1 Tax=Streptomyces sp. NPDC008079 TaxID=3364806 RepID=UPI0036EE3AAB